MKRLTFLIALLCFVFTSYSQNQKLAQDQIGGVQAVDEYGGKIYAAVAAGQVYSYNYDLSGKQLILDLVNLTTVNDSISGMKINVEFGLNSIEPVIYVQTSGDELINTEDNQDNDEAEKNRIRRFTMSGVELQSYPSIAGGKVWFSEGGRRFVSGSVGNITTFGSWTGTFNHYIFSSDSESFAFLKGGAWNSKHDVSLLADPGTASNGNEVGIATLDCNFLFQIEEEHVWGGGFDANGVAFLTKTCPSEVIFYNPVVDVNGQISDYIEAGRFGLGFMDFPTDIEILQNGNKVVAETGSDVISLWGDPNALPVELIDFKMAVSEKEHIAKWESGAEQNLDRYELQRSSTVDSGYETIGTKLPNGSNSVYSLSVNLKSGSSYYRLRIVDKDGSEQFSDIVFIEGRKEQIAVKVSPNPTSDFIQISGVEDVNYQLSDTFGVRVRFGEGKTVSVNGLMAGTYYLTIYRADGSQIAVKPVVVK